MGAQCQEAAGVSSLNVHALRSGNASTHMEASDDRLDVPYSGWGSCQQRKGTMIVDGEKVSRIDDIVLSNACTVSRIYTIP